MFGACFQEVFLALLKCQRGPPIAALPSFGSANSHVEAASWPEGVEVEGMLWEGCGKLGAQCFDTP